MSTRANRIERYYDTHEVEGEELGQSGAHFKAIKSLVAVLEWFFFGKKVTVLSEVNLYQTPNAKETPKCPDIAVVEGAESEIIDNDADGLPSYYIGEDGPPPRIVFEISSRETWKVDLVSKPNLYKKLGVREYFVFDPNKHPLWTGDWRKHERLVGWRYDASSDQMVELVKDAQNRLWSEELQSFLVVEMEGENPHLRLYDTQGQLRLTKAEANEQQALIEKQRAEVAERAAEMERQQREDLRLRLELERRQLELERTRAETQKQELEVERTRAERLAEMLRQLGKNPDELL